MLIGAYYYPWYSSRWLKRTMRRDDPPVLGEYDNTKYGLPVVQHMRTCKKAGIDFVSVSWDPRIGHYEHVLEAAEDEGIQITIFYESLTRATGKSQTIIRADWPNIIGDMKRLAEDMGEKSWFKIDGKPVVMIYVSRNYKEVQEIFSKIREVFGNKVFIVGDEIFWGETSIDRIQCFDACTTYNWYASKMFSGTTDQDVCNSFMLNIHRRVNEILPLHKEANIPYWPVVMPGYDDRRVRPNASHHPIPRLNGQFFERSLEEVKGYEVVLVTSYGEWYEDTQIEPAISYGNTYLDMLKKFKSASGIIL